MTGHVFHPGHAPLHGITVVVETRDQRTYVGRFDTEDGGGVHILDAGVHDLTDASPISKDDYIRKCSKFGVPRQHKHVIVPTAEITRISRLSDIERSLWIRSRLTHDAHRALRRNSDWWRPGRNRGCRLARSSWREDFTADSEPRHCRADVV